MLRSVRLLDHFSAPEDPREGWRVFSAEGDLLLMLSILTLVSGRATFSRIWPADFVQMNGLGSALWFSRGLP